MTEPNRWREVTAARIPAEHIAALAPVRNRVGLRVHLYDATAWVTWSIGNADVVNYLLPVPGVVLFTHRRGAWFKFGNRLPSDEIPPAGEGQPLAAVLVPARFQATAPPSSELVAGQLRIVRGGEPNLTSALVCTVNDLLKWAETATTASLLAVRAARSGNRAVLLGSSLPTIGGAVRFWGKDVLVPVGFRADPDLPAFALRTACGVTDSELLFLDEAGAEVIPRSAFEPLTRAGIRLGAMQP